MIWKRTETLTQYSAAAVSPQAPRPRLASPAPRQDRAVARSAPPHWPPPPRLEQPCRLRFASSTSVSRPDHQPASVFVGKPPSQPRKNRVIDPCTVRVRSKLVLSHRLHGVDARYFVVCRDYRPRRQVLDHSVGFADAAVIRSVEACGNLIHYMLAEAPVTAGYDLAADN
ncbi:hypothetical protein D1007_12344 [Hordeum vulgare]|nr:hypothetical protein D1007_12344 [Hordeum vulgare]